MAINQNHLFEELNGVKCAIAEKNVPAERVEFLRGILEYNKYTVVVVPSPPPKGEDAVAPETFTVGVTDVMFNPVNAIFGRLLKTPDGHVVTLAYWQQKEKESNDEAPYFGKGQG
ncbi:MAG TPA: hypothetical protein VHC48_22515 [Puia sp.]|jgi:hypothetical protein|nr:hypothetical protein [Puia sp.]